jgi:hypothetical protein
MEIVTSSRINMKFPQSTDTLKYLMKLHKPVAQWLRYSATNRKVAGSIPYGVIGIFH